MKRPNILFIMSDDHAAHAISAYGSRINQTPQIDRIARDGAMLSNCHCTNALCTPSRATILTGQYGHVTGVKTLNDPLDSSRPVQVQKLLQQAGYATAIFGKWHLGQGAPHDPQGFDAWEVLPGQGLYHDPKFITPEGTRRRDGYVSDVITDLSLGWLGQRDASKPFCLMVHHKAPHRHWEPGERYKHLYENETIPEPATWHDDYSNRAAAARMADMRVRDMGIKDVKQEPPAGLQGEELASWKYQRYIKDYLRCVASVDASVGRLLDYLDEHNLAEDTIVAYTSDQGFFLGDHGWYDKRFMYEESLRMPFLVRYPREIPAGGRTDAIFTNHDFAPTFLDYAGIAIPPEMQGVSARAVWRGQTPSDWQKSLYYRYWMHLAHHRVCSHYGVRNHRHKLIYYYSQALGCTGAIDEPMPPEWELFDLEKDPQELRSVYDDPAYAPVRREMLAELDRLQAKYGDEPLHASA